MKTEAQKWGETAIAFIGSALATAIFGTAAYFLQPIQWLAVTSCAIAAVFFVVFAINSIAIVRWWVVIAKRGSSPGSSGVGSDGEKQSQ